jgi:3-methyladenine DNA glycosylase Tag
VDPVTIMAGATAAFNAIKKGIQVGRDLQDMSGQLSQWAGCMSDLGRAESKAKNPPWWKALSNDVEREAIEIFAAKRKAEAMRKELKQFISFNMGPSAWKELLRIEGQVRKRKKEQEYRKEEVKEAIITWAIGTIVTIMAGGLVGITFYFIGKAQGKW